MKVYAVRKGNKIGIFESWNDCQEAIKGYSGAEFKSFATIDEAQAYLENRDIWREQVAKDNSDGYLVAFTDGSYDKSLQRYSYGVHFINIDGNESDICGYGDNPKYLDSNNIIGEIFGVINALDWAISNGCEKIKIYHDYEGLSKWVSGEWKANSEVAKMYFGVYNSKFKDFLDVVFVKVPGHCNVIYNDKADQLAKSALINKKKVAVKGNNWFSITNFNEENFDTLVTEIELIDSNITHITDKQTNKIIHRFKLNAETVTVTLFLTGQHKLLLQGKNSSLFQIVTSVIIESCKDIHIEQIFENAYRTNIEHDIVSRDYGNIANALPSNYPDGIKRLIKQSIINLSYSIDGEDYSMYAFPAFRALEGHIKYLIKEAGGTTERQFDCFNRKKTGDPYYVTKKFPDQSKNGNLENCYNYYKPHRDTTFHFGDILGTTDNTRIMETKDEADEIIKKCIELIIKEQ